MDDLRPSGLLWGPYLWADGENGRKIDELVRKPEDLAGKGTHPRWQRTMVVRAATSLKTNQIKTAAALGFGVAPSE